MKPAQIYMENAGNCALLAEEELSTDGPLYKRFKRMEAAWRSQWLDGEISPVESTKTLPSANK